MRDETSFDVELVTEEVCQRYRIVIDTAHDWVMFKDPTYPVLSASMRANRFNPDNRPAWYTASGIEVAKAEVPNHAEQQLYVLRPGPYVAFNTQQFAVDFGLEDQFLKSKNDHGYGFCQEVAARVMVLDTTVSGMLYTSYAMHAQGKQGVCLAILPPSGVELYEGFFKIKKY
jgi:hypothetical protein